MADLIYPNNMPKREVDRASFFPQETERFTGQDHTLDSAFFVPMVPDCSSQSVEVTVLLSWDGFSTEGEDPFQAHPPVLPCISTQVLGAQRRRWLLLGWALPPPPSPP